MTKNFQNYIMPARNLNSLWRVFGTLALSFVLYMGVSIVVLNEGATRLGHSGFLQEENPSFDKPDLMVLLLSTFVVWLLALLLAVWVFHKRGLPSLIGAGPFKFLKGFFIAGLSIILITFILGLVFPEAQEVVPNLDYSIWITYFPFALILMFIQVSTEEVLFRGYLQQQLAVRFQSRWVYMLIPSILFGLGHFSLSLGVMNGILIFGITTFLGLILADLTYRTGHLGPAIGIHFVNNLSAMFFVSYQEDTSGLALYTLPAYFDNQELLAATLMKQAILMVIVGALYFIFMESRARNRLQSN